MGLRKDSIAAQAALLNQLLTDVASPAMREAGISGSVFELLSAIGAGTGKDTQAEVARRMGITPPSLSEAVQSAIAKDLVIQSKSATDGRKKTLSLTRKGKTTLSRVLKEIERAEQEIVEFIEPSELLNALDTLKKLNRALATRLITKS